jgi:hypothetical protein
MADPELERLLTIVKYGDTFDALRASRQVVELKRARKRAQALRETAPDDDAASPRVSVRAGK